MAGTRSSARQAEKNNSSPQSAENSGTKRKAGEDATPEIKSERPSKEQKTLEETMKPSEDVDKGVGEGFDEEMKEAEAQASGEQKIEDTKDEQNALEQVKADEKDAGTTSKVSPPATD